MGNNGHFPGVKSNFDLGGNDFGVLTYAYALEQLESTSIQSSKCYWFSSTFNDIEKKC
jgi:hypothetical protein